MISGLFFTYELREIYFCLPAVTFDPLSESPKTLEFGNYNIEGLHKSGEGLPINLTILLNIKTKNIPFTVPYT